MPVRVLLVNSVHRSRRGDCVHVLALEKSLTSKGRDVAISAMHHAENLSSAWSTFWAENVESRGGFGSLKSMEAASPSTGSGQVVEFERGILSRSPTPLRPPAGRSMACQRA